MTENEKLLDLFENYKKDLCEMDRNEVFQISSTVESIIQRHFNAECAYKQDLDYVRKNLGIMLAFKNDNGHMGQNLEVIKKFFSGLLDSLIDEIRTIGIPNKSNKKDSLVNVNVMQNQSQEQQQSQEQIFSLFFESIKDEISGKQLKELKDIASKEPDPEKAKPQIIEKIKSFGSDICASIVANIITNPAIWSGLF